LTTVPLMAEEIHKLLEELEPLLKSCDPDCLDFIDSLRLIPGSDELVMYMENFDFKSAAKVLKNLSV